MTHCCNSFGAPSEKFQGEMNKPEKEEEEEEENREREGERGRERERGREGEKEREIEREEREMERLALRWRRGMQRAEGFAPTPLRNGALSHRLRLLGQTVLWGMARGWHGLSLRQHESRALSTEH